MDAGCTNVREGVDGIDEAGTDELSECHARPRAMTKHCYTLAFDGHFSYIFDNFFAARLAGTFHTTWYLTFDLKGKYLDCTCTPSLIDSVPCSQSCPDFVLLDYHLCLHSQSAILLMIGVAVRGLATH